MCAVCFFTQLCPTLCVYMDCSPPGFSVHVDSPGKNTGVGCCVLLQGIFPIQSSNPGLPQCRWIIYYLSHQGSPRILKWAACAFSRNLSNSGIELGSPAVQVNSLPAQIPGKPNSLIVKQHLYKCFLN